MEQGCNDGFWRHLKAHTMGKITSRDALNRIADDIGEVWDDCWRAQTSRWRQFMFSRGYLDEDIEAFCRYSLMAVVLTSTYHNFHKLLSKIRDLSNSATGAMTWKGGRAEAMATHHANKLQVKRRLAGSYTQHILKSYVYLRDAKKTGFRDQAMLDSVYGELQDLRSTLQGLQQGGGTRTGPDPKCNHCGGKHSGSKAKCAAKDLSPAAAKALVRAGGEGAGMGKLKKMAAYVKDHLDADETNLQTVLDEAKEAAR